MSKRTELKSAFSAGRVNSVQGLFSPLFYRWDCWRFMGQRADYIEYLHAVLAGVDYQRTLADVFQADSQRYGQTHWRGRLAQVWLNSLRQSGGDLYAVWQDCLSEDELMLIRATQNAGVLEHGLEALANYLEMMSRHRRLLLAILWPALIGVWVPLALLAAIPIYTAPALQLVFQDLPEEFYGPRTQQLFSLAYFLQSDSPLLLLAGGVISVFVYLVFVRRMHGARRLLDRWSIFQLLRQMAALRLLTLLAVLLRPSSRMQLSLRAALETIEQGAGHWLGWHLKLMLERIRHGEVGASTLRTGLLDPDMYWFFSDMSQVHRLDQAAWLTAQRLRTQVLQSGQNLAVRWRWLILGTCVMLTLVLGLWHYIAMDELRQGLSLFYAGA